MANKTAGKKGYKDIRSIEVCLHQDGDKQFTKCFLLANTIEQAVAILQEKFPEKNYCFANVITHRFIKNEDLVEYLNNFKTTP